MSDFLLDFRDGETRRRSARAAASLLRFCEATRVQVMERESFTLVLTRVDDGALWDPCSSLTCGKELLGALAGRIALEEQEWEAAAREPGPGGLACKTILKRYRVGGIDALRSLNGNFVALVFDEQTAAFHLVTDRCGMFLAYCPAAIGNPPVYCSHPDVLASVLGEDQRLDMTSLSEFLMTGRLSFPYTYYRGIKAIEPGSIHTLSLRGAARLENKRQYFRFDCKIDARAAEPELAEELAEAFSNAVRRRTLPIFGTTGIGLSGGLDSRAILSATRGRAHVRTFTLFDEENEETRTAGRLAEACGVEMIPIQRDFEYYGNSAELGVRISGGVGNIASNHFLGIRGRLSRLGMGNLLTGCYCDYLLKGLALNTSEQRLSRLERLAHFNFEFYHPHYSNQTAHRQDVEDRLRASFPQAGERPLSEEDWFNIQCSRTFPLAYEGDLAQRVIPQRVMPWYLPILDNDIIDLYLRIPLRYKLGASLFRKMVLQLCDQELCRIPDNNTGARIDASGARYAFHRYLSALRNRIRERLLPGMATRGSWPNWEYYISRSRTVQSLWARKNNSARDLFVQLLGCDPFSRSTQGYRGRQVEQFMRLFTLKLWLDQRMNVSSPVRDRDGDASLPPRQQALVNVA